MIPQTLFLQEELRSELKTPLGELIPGTIEETSPIIKSKLSNLNQMLIGVGDVTAEILVALELEPNLVITDGLNKRSKYPNLEFDGYHVIHASSPAAVISVDAWNAIITSKDLISKGYKVHLIIDGEEDLLVLPILVEFELYTKIVYGQPNVGSVIRTITEESKEYALKFMGKMKKI